MEDHEAEYLKAVQHELRDVPRRQRRELLALTSTVLEERPTTGSADELGKAMGYPWQHAVRLRGEHGIPAHVPWLVRVASASRRAHVAMVLVPALLAGATFAAATWFTADPGLRNSCAGAQADPGVAIEIREAAGASERRISYVDGAEVRMMLCIGASDAVHVRSVGVPSAPGSLFQYRTFQAEPDINIAPASARGDRGEGFTIDPDGEAWEGAWRVYVIGRMAACEWNSPGGGTSFHTVPVTYRYRGRTRRTFVDLLTSYTFTSPPTAECPRPAEYDS